MTSGQDAQYAVSHREVELASTPDVSAALRELIESADGGPGPLADMARHLPIAVLAADADGVFTVAQGAALDRLGLGHGELVGSSAAGWGPDAAAVSDRVNGGRAQVFDSEGQFGDAVFRYRCLGVPDGKGGSLTLVMDLTTVLEAERSASASQELIQSALDASGAALVVQDADGLILTVNQAATAIVGLPTDATAGLDPLAWLDPIHEDGAPFAIDEMPHRTALRTGVPQRNVKMGVRTEGGERRWVSATAYPITLDGREAVMTGMAELADRQTTEGVLRDSDERFRLMAERAPIGIFVMNRGARCST